MLRIYYGRENVDKDRVMFEKIGLSLASLGEANSPAHVLLLVPDQYTLQMERNAISRLKVEGLMDLEVLSFSRLAARVLNETGGSRRTPIDKYGRHMLISKIMRDEAENLNAFRGMDKSQSFIELANNFISEMKQHNSSPEEIAGHFDRMEEGSLLKRKLEDIWLIYNRYEEQIKGKYTDVEDHLNFFITKIKESSLVGDGEFWISGFDTFTPKVINIIRELVLCSGRVNLFLTYDGEDKGNGFFYLAEEVISRLKNALPSNMVEEYKIEDHKRQIKPPIAHLENNLFRHPHTEFPDGDDTIRFCRAANIYNEAETAASFIMELIRDKGYRFKDIAVICNDMDGRGAVIKRVFDEYGISYFMDQKRRITHNPAIIFISALLDLIQSSYAYEDVFRLVKTGLTPLDSESGENLENYVIRYRIRGNRWKKDFKYGVKEYSEVEFNCLNSSRKLLMDFIGYYESRNKTSKTVREKTEALLGFLKEDVELESKLEEYCLDLETLSEFEAAMEVQQIWEGIQNIFEQIIELIGDEVVSRDDYNEILKTGLESIELGLIPTTIDQVVLGTMQRTRIGDIKALLVLGANDGVLPADSSGDGILNRDEKALLLQNDINICRDDDSRVMEERLAIYKQLSNPGEHLWIGFSVADMEGKEIRPSIIFDKIHKIFPDIPLEKDLLNREDQTALVCTADSSIKNLSDALCRAENEGEKLNEVWKCAYNWYKENEEEKLLPLIKGLSFTNKMDNLESSLISRLFGREWDREIKVSPSRLERFSKCKFAHFVHYGLAPKENRVFEVGGREIGDIYHQCLMMFAEELTVKGLALNDEESPWMSLTREECSFNISRLMRQIASTYKEGVLGSGEEEIYRAGRMQIVCEKAAWALVEHVRQGKISEVYFEEAFTSDPNSLLPPIKITAGGKDFLIEGKVDRIDILPGGYVKVIDYKSGAERFDLKEALGGWRLQLMLYLKAAKEGLQANKRDVKPAGVFYFEIADTMINVDGFTVEDLQEKLETQLRKQFRLDGITVNEPEIIENIAGEFSGYSEVLPIRKNKDGLVSGTSENKLLTAEEFQVFSEAMDEVIAGLCETLAKGEIHIQPMKNKDETACKYCDYKSICNFELSFDGCVYRVVK